MQAQTAEKRNHTGEMDQLLLEIIKLKRIAETATQFKETYTDKFASFNEKEYAFEKLGESLEEYELFLEGY